MAVWLARSRTTIRLLKKKIASPNHCSIGSNSSYKTLAGGYSSRNPHGFRDKSASILSFRRPESAKPTEQVETTGGDNENQGMEFPGGRVLFTSQMKFISESADKRMPCYRVLDDDGYPVAGSKYEHLDKEKAMKIYESMVTLQVMDTIFYEAQRQGRLSFYLTAAGEESVNIATAAALTPDDVILAQYREQGVLLWRGFTLQEFANQLFGTKDDFGKGRQMPIHYGTKQHNYITISSPLATQLPQSVGVAYSLRMDNKEACAVAFTGEGASRRFPCCFNFAAVLDAPVMFVCRNNGWAISTPVLEQFRSDGIVVKGQAYGIRSIRVYGNDAIAVYSAIRSARELVIREQKPTLLVEALTYRVGHHSTSDDSTNYRSTDEIEHWRTARNPITRYRKWVQRNGWWNDEEETELRSSIRKQVLKAIQAADKTKKPSLENLFTDVYDTEPSNLQEQERSLRGTIKRHQHDYPADVPVHTMNS